MLEPARPARGFKPCDIMFLAASRFVAEPQRLYYNSSSNGLDTVSRHLVTSPKRHPGTRPPMDEVLPLQHIISAELFMPREFATAMLVRFCCGRMSNVKSHSSCVVKFCPKAFYDANVQ